MSVDIRVQAFDPYAELARHCLNSGTRTEVGASAIFIGSMRDFNDGAAVEAMTLEHYPGMTEKHLTRLVQEVRARPQVLDALIVHRVGDLLPGEPIVLVAVWAAHRASAFEACRYLIEELKRRAPFWKKEKHGAATRWVEHNTPGE